MPESTALIRCAYADEQSPFERHFHNAYELLYIKSGTVEISIQGNNFTAGPETLVFIGKLEEHSVRIVSGEYRRYYALFSPEQLERLVSEPRLRSAFINRPKNYSPFFRMDSFSSEAERLFLSILKEYRDPQPFSADYIAALLNQLLILCYRSHSGQFPLPDKNVSPEIFAIQRYIEQHFSEEIRISDLAAAHFISPCHLSHSFREWFGYSPKQYIMLNRISYAKELLIGTSLPISEVAAKSGFSDTNNFIRSFKKETGVTPVHYRRER